jgi:polyisoprenoid-binding protein YceI
LKTLFSLTFLMSAFVLSSTSGFAGTVTDCEISFKTIGSPVLVSIEGKSGNPCTGQLVATGEDLSASTINMNLEKLDTGIPLRNKHLRENYLETSKYPEAKLTNLKVTDYSKQVSGKADGASKFTADLEMHGQKKPISGTYEVRNGNEFKGTFQIEIVDFGIPRPDFMGVQVVDKVTLSFKLKNK